MESAIRDPPAAPRGLPRLETRSVPLDAAAGREDASERKHLVPAWSLAGIVLETPVGPDHSSHSRSRTQARERSATTESGAAFGQRMPFPGYVSAQGPVPTPWTQVDPVVFSRLRRAAPGELQRPCGCAWSNSGRMVENVSRRARSVDVFQQGRFLFPCQPLTSPLPKSQFHRTRGRLSFQDRLQ